MDPATSTAVTALVTGVASTADQMQAGIGQVLPYGMAVGGTVLVVMIGWRLFRNFSRG